MKHQYRKVFLTVCLCIFCMMGLVSVVSSQASSISELQEDMQQNQQEKEQAEGQLSELQKSKEAVEGYLNDLNVQIFDINNQLLDLNEQIGEKEKEIATNQEELNQAKAVEEEQYQSMKLRIQFLYEMGDTSYIDLFMKAGTFSDFLNKAEYVDELVSYDRKMLVSYRETKDKIVLTQRKLEKEKEELLALQQDAKEQQLLLTAQIDTAQNEIVQYSEQISEAEKLALEYEKKIEEQKNSIEALQKEEEKRRKAEEEANKQGSEDTYVDYDLEDNDLVLLATIIYCEAGGESYAGKLAVGSVVMNRVHSSSFPNSISAVIYQSGQFTPVASGRFAMALASGVGSECYSAAQEVLDGNITGKWLFFRTNNGSVSGTVIDHQVFY